MPFASDDVQPAAAQRAKPNYGVDPTPEESFKGEAFDKLGDGAFADPRETRLISLWNNLKKINKLFADPLGIQAYFDDAGAGAEGGQRASDHGSKPPTGDQAVTGVFDP